jgi:hypothetical protein
MINQELDFSFKGKRDYVQGTDMFNESARFLGSVFGSQIEYVEFIIHRMVSSNLTLQLYGRDEAPQLDARVVATLKFSTNAMLWEAHLIPSERQPKDRFPYDEFLVIEKCKIDLVTKSISFCSDSSPYSAVETLVAMNKALHLKLFPDLDTQWVFCRWDSHFYPLAENLYGVSINLKQALGTRLTKAEIILQGNILGYIYFSAKDK